MTVSGTADEIFLARAVALAQHNVGTGDGGPFGAVIVRDGCIIGEGRNQVIAHCDPTAHAEVQAIRAACRHAGHFHLPDTVLYASSEPCPLCLSAAYWARIPRIVFANRRSEAAAIGFCDDELYCELNLPAEARRIVMQHLPLAGARQPLSDWLAQADRTPY